MGNLTFQEQGHIYKVDGVEIPSVTRILEAVGLSDMSKVPQDILKRSQDFGKAVHRTIELHTKGTLELDSLDTSLWPYLKAWKAFVNDYGYKFKKSEYQFYHPTYRYAGTIDQMGEITKGKHAGPAIGDIKSGGPTPSHKYQLNGGYRLAIGKVNTFILYLNPEFKPDGYKVVFSTIAKHEQNVFLSALTLYNVRKKEGLL